MSRFTVYGLRFAVPGRKWRTSALRGRRPIPGPPENPNPASVADARSIGRPEPPDTPTIARRGWNPDLRPHTTLNPPGNNDAKHGRESVRQDPISRRTGSAGRW